MEIPHCFFLFTLGNSTSFLINSWTFHMLFLWYSWKFHILNPPVWFEFLVMTEKYFCLLTFFVIKYFRFQFIFYAKIAPAPHKKVTPFFLLTPLKVEVLSSPSLSDNLVGGSTSSRKGVGCTLCYMRWAGSVNLAGWLLKSKPAWQNKPLCFQLTEVILT